MRLRGIPKHNQVMKLPRGLNRQALSVLTSRTAPGGPLVGRTGHTHEVARRIDQREVGECLREIPQLPFPRGIIFFREQPYVITQREQMIE